MEYVIKNIALTMPGASSSMVSKYDASNDDPSFFIEFIYQLYFESDLWC